MKQHKGNQFAGGTASYFNGTIEDARILATGSRQSWITTEYNNQSSPTTFFTLGPQQ
jgi:hypothetical protein